MSAAASVADLESHRVALEFAQAGLDVTVVAPCGPIGPGDVGPTPTGRLLLNLKHIFVEREDYASALAAVERLLLIKPGDVTELRDRGFLKAHLGRAGSAIVDLEAYLNQTPEAPDADSVRGRVSWLRRKLSEMN